jgi:glycosyltransferase involved in cell wall biosynthesis
MVSVALATFRGKAFINEQLRSIIGQSTPPSEVVVFDDASDDGTFEVVQEFASKSGVRVVACRQPQNRGLIGNFESAVVATKGDVIFLADQDDVWYPQKISRVLETFDGNPAIGLVFSDADLVDQNLKPLGKTLWNSIGFNQAERAQMRSPLAFDLLLKRFLVTGATLAFRRCFLELVLPLPRHLIHDAWIALAIGAVSRIECIDEPLIQYRQHSGQQIGERESWRNWLTQWQAAKKSPPEYFHEQRCFFEQLLDRLEPYESRWAHAGVGELARQKLRHLERRIGFRERRAHSLPAIASEFARGEYSRFSYGWKSAAQDIFL